MGQYLKSRQNEFDWKIFFFFSKLWANLAASLFVHSPQLWALLCGLLCDLIVGAKVVTKLHTHLMSLLPYKKGFTITVFMLFAFTHQKEQPATRRKSRHLCSVDISKRQFIKLQKQTTHVFRLYNPLPGDPSREMTQNYSLYDSSLT